MYKVVPRQKIPSDREHRNTRDPDTDRQCTHMQLVVLSLPLCCRKQGWSGKDKEKRLPIAVQDPHRKENCEITS